LASADVSARVGEEHADEFRVLELGLLLLFGFGASMVASLYSQWHPLHAVHRMRESLDDLAAALPALCLLVYVLGRRGLRLRDLGLTARWSDLVAGLALAVIGSRLVRPSGHLSTSALAPLTLVIVFLRAAHEELIVRAYMMTEVAELTGSAFLAVMGSTCFQALYHLYQGREAALRAAGTFLIFSVFYWKTRRATPLVLGHFGHNLWIYLHH